MSDSAKRYVEVLIISDIHLGTYGCRAKELISYIKSLDIGMLILNGDIIDMWQFNKYYWPKSHMKVLRLLFKLIANGVPVYYITGNHDELMRRFSGTVIGNLKIMDKLILELDGRYHWIFHGDIFDFTMKHSRWLAKLGGWAYDFLIVLNSFLNFVFERILGRGRISLSKKIKNSVKSAVSFIDDFEQTAASIAIDKGYDAVICGHIHQPSIKTISISDQEIQYLNSGDWIENLSALEYAKGEWNLYRHILGDIMEEEDEPSTKTLHDELLLQFQLTS